MASPAQPNSSSAITFAQPSFNAPCSVFPTCTGNHGPTSLGQFAVGSGPCRAEIQHRHGLQCDHWLSSNKAHPAFLGRKSVGLGKQGATRAIHSRVKVSQGFNGTFPAPTLQTTSTHWRSNGGARKCSEKRRDAAKKEEMVEPRRFELLTLCVQSRCSTN